MILHDPIADLLVRIRNRTKDYVLCPHSRIKEQICIFLQKEGYIGSYSVEEANNKKTLLIDMRNTHIDKIVRVSKPSRRIYVRSSSIPRYYSDIGTYCISTSQGILNDKEARERKLGGEIMFKVL